jgi:glycosyltransferase involved in cell wall biosynthesis
MKVDHHIAGYAGGHDAPSVAQTPSPLPAGTRVAIAHEWLTVPGGSEKVVQAMLDLLPEAELFTSVCDPARWSELIRTRSVHTTFLDHLPGARQHYTYLLPLMDAAFRALDLSSYDVVISSNHASAKSVRPAPGVPHVCYCHTPMRYAWDADFLEHEAIGPLFRHLLPAATAWLRRVDRRRAAGPDVFVANSTYVAARIARVYGRHSQVIHPPVDIAPLLSVPRDPDDAYLVFGRVVPYKRVDTAVLACRRLGRRLIVAGSGRDLDRVRGLAGPGVEFLGEVSDAEAAQLFSRARALLFPGVEDFGIVPVEAQAAGLPVIGYGEGGLRDSVTDGRTGVLYPEATVDGLVNAITRFESLSLQESELRHNAERFSPAHFAGAFSQLLASLTTTACPADTLDRW